MLSQKEKKIRTKFFSCKVSSNDKLLVIFIWIKSKKLKAHERNKIKRRFRENIRNLSQNYKYVFFLSKEILSVNFASLVEDFSILKNILD